LSGVAIADSTPFFLRDFPRARGWTKPMNANRLNPHNLRIVLVLQGGGALGAYQGGVYQAMHEHGTVPDWIVGTSIGAINAALIAGNQQADRVHRVRAFWERVAPDGVDMARVSDQQRRVNIMLNTADIVVRGARGFQAARVQHSRSGSRWRRKTPRSTTPRAARALEELVDFAYLNEPGGSG
jgi:NTE family protein